MKWISVDFLLETYMKAVIEKDTIKQHTYLFYMIENQCRLRYSKLCTTTKKLVAFVILCETKCATACDMHRDWLFKCYNTLTTDFLIE